MKPKMTLEDHLELAADFAGMHHYINRVFFRMQNHYPKSSSMMRFMFRILPTNLMSKFQAVKYELDSDYHSVITEEEYQKYGHVYYRAEEIYKTGIIHPAWVPENCGVDDE